MSGSLGGAGQSVNQSSQRAVFIAVARISDSIVGAETILVESVRVPAHNGFTDRNQDAMVARR
jgi:hypothetical protein